MTDPSEKKRSPLSKVPRNAAEIDQLGIALFGAKKWARHRASLDCYAAKRKERDAKGKADGN
jgi:hypothetical protein